jgi:CubicO group peptidase (beta-lactamase class C family)
VNLRAAFKYSAQHNGRACVVRQRGAFIGEVYQNGFSKGQSWDIESGSKSFNGVLCAALIDDGLIESFDTKVSTVITEWSSGTTQKQNCTLRQLLSLTSGLAPGQIGNPPTYESAIGNLMPANDVGTFKYGPAPFCVFGLFVNRLVQPLGYTNAVDYLQRRVLPIVQFGSWDLIQGNPEQPHLAGGAHLTIREWARFGEMMCRDITNNELFADLIVPRTAGTDPLYGTTWWLCMDNNRSKPIPHGGFAAGGANNQRLIVLPQLNLVVARFGAADATWSDETFLNRLLA